MEAKKACFYKFLFEHLRKEFILILFRTTSIFPVRLNPLTAKDELSRPGNLTFL